LLNTLSERIFASTDESGALEIDGKPFSGVT